MERGETSAKETSATSVCAKSAEKASKSTIAADERDMVEEYLEVF
jgi:hypothetical protein